MNKLTKEQAQWLIEQLDKGIGNETNLVCSEIVEIINQCTDLEFPILDLKIRHKEEINIRTEDTIIILSTDAKVSEFNYQQFKQFTEGCSKIVQWIDEQNAE